MIEVKDLVKEYPGKRAVDGVSFSISRGEVAGLLGVNGAGKSTVMNMITGYTAMTAGTVTVDGLDILDEPMAVRKKIGYLPEIPPLYVDMTVEEYLGFAFRLKKIRTCCEDEIASVCKTLDITDVRKKLIRHLSKGYRQRVGFAQALVGSPEALILDEPTVGLDPKQMIEIRKVIQTLGKKHTIIISSHLLGEVQAVCDRILVMDQGKLVADDRADSLSHRTGTTERVRVRVTGKEEEILRVLLSVEGVKRAKRTVARESGTVEFSVEAEKSRDSSETRMRITKGLAENGMYVVEMQAENMNLEEIFLKLTSGAAKKTTAGEREKRKEREEKE